ncbi:hypothetical protein D3C76_759200 [compost metagenome]|jgi:hypothetical protein
MLYLGVIQQALDSFLGVFDVYWKIGTAMLHDSQADAYQLDCSLHGNSDNAVAYGTLLLQIRSHSIRLFVQLSIG